MLLDFESYLDLLSINSNFAKDSTVFFKMQQRRSAANIWGDPSFSDSILSKQETRKLQQSRE